MRSGEAWERAQAAIDQLRRKGVTARIVGSLAKGTFGAGSDIDLLVTECPRDLKYAIEGQVEECLGEFTFDVIYLDEVSPRRRDALLKEATDAGSIG